MNDLKQIELLELRRLIIFKSTEYKKLINYAEYAIDPQIKQIFNKYADKCLEQQKILIKFIEK